jgi:hypothetical protein
MVEDVVADMGEVLKQMGVGLLVRWQMLTMLEAHSNHLSHIDTQAASYRHAPPPASLSHNQHTLNLPHAGGPPRGVALALTGFSGLTNGGEDLHLRVGRAYGST